MANLPDSTKIFGALFCELTTIPPQRRETISYKFLAHPDLNHIAPLPLPSTQNPSHKNQDNFSELRDRNHFSPKFRGGKKLWTPTAPGGVKPRSPKTSWTWNNTEPKNKLDHGGIYVLGTSRSQSRCATTPATQNPSHKNQDNFSELRVGSTRAWSWAIGAAPHNPPALHLEDRNHFSNCGPPTNQQFSNCGTNQRHRIVPIFFLKRYHRTSFSRSSSASPPKREIPIPHSPGLRPEVHVRLRSTSRIV